MLNLRVLFLAFALTGFSVEAIEKDNQLNQEQYVPPKMPEYPKSYDDVMITLAPHYQAEQPLDYFFELYIISVLEKLPNETEAALQEFNRKHPSFFESTNGDWRVYVKQQLHLSNTIDVAIWDLWIRNSANAKNNGWEYHPWHFAQNFLENYFAEGSKIDIWEGNSVEIAKQKIAKFRENGN
ncbi:hypothetical protein GSF04_22360 [Pseudoalteromonas sp. A22]|uniref:hypothetical protein n=1 Tax=Pseudoalteromonas sp. A22 TaxID=327511 RepID=UPI001BADE96A|nr:hypothetical protein [Pseudoalteromonas sp. A22]QUI65067.1 hypothetical protein GSF04_22360 [Pseudoalteromonas sp. A22]